VDERPGWWQSFPVTGRGIQDGLPSLQLGMILGRAVLTVVASWARRWR
jgi:hypothetical protein